MLFKFNFHVRLVLFSVMWCESNGDLPVALQYRTVKYVNDIAFHMIVTRLSLITVPKWYSDFCMDHYSGLALNF